MSRSRNDDEIRRDHRRSGNERRERRDRDSEDRERTRVPVRGDPQPRERPDGTIVRDHRTGSGTSRPDIDWQPTVLTPVFFGVADFNNEAHLPGELHVFYPSLDGAVAGAELLRAPERFPLIVFLHGNCNEPVHYKRWYRLPAALARSGYIVAVPDLPNIREGKPPWDEEQNDHQLVELTLSWLRNRSEFGDSLTTREIGIIGHSFGALLGGDMVRRIRQSRVLHRYPYMSLSGVWRRWPEFSLGELRTPSVFVWGTGLDLSEEMYAQLITPEGDDVRWGEIPTPKHNVQFHEGHHWDWLPDGVEQPCGVSGERGPCDLAMPLAADFACTFFNRYLPPPGTDAVADRIGDDLIAPKLDLTDEQEFFAGGHLVGMSRVDGSAGCSVTHNWELPRGASGSVTLGP
jgi:acetyl esterase/lipase